MKNCLFFLLLLVTPALAAPPTVGSLTASATGGLHNVSVEMTVENHGKEPSDPATAVVRFKPQTHGRPTAPIQQPLEQRQPIPALAPGEKTVLTISSPYNAKGDFHGQRGSFRAYNVDPTQEIPVEFQGSVQASGRH